MEFNLFPSHRTRRLVYPRSPSQEKYRSMPPLIEVNDFRQTAVSCVNDELMSIAVCGIAQASMNIFQGQIVEILHDFFRRHT